MANIGLAQKTKKAQSEDLDQILDVAHELENLTQEEAEALALELISSKGFNDFKLGGVLAVIKDNGWINGMKDFSDYVLKTFGIKYRKATYLLKIYNTLVNESIPWEKVSMLGWNKLAALTAVINAENVDEWVAKCQSPTNYPTVLALVKQALNPDSDTEDDSKITTDVTKMSFTMHPDQKAIVTDAIEKAKEEVSTEFSTVALENICMGYLSGSVAVNKSLRDQMKEAGYITVLSLFEELWPQINIEVKDKSDDE